MTNLETLQTYENWKSAKKSRKIWMNVIAWVSGLFLAYITVCLISKAGIGNVLKVAKYSSTDIETKEQRNNIPDDYLTWYKNKKMDQSWVQKKLGNEPSPHFTYEEIAKRKAKKQGEDWFGELGGKLAEWLASQGVDESKKKEVDYIAYAHDIYSNAWTVIFWGTPLFWTIFALTIRYLVLPFCWKEPKLNEAEN